MLHQQAESQAITCVFSLRRSGILLVEQIILPPFPLPFVTGKSPSSLQSSNIDALGYVAALRRKEEIWTCYCRLLPC